LREAAYADVPIVVGCTLDNSRYFGVGDIAPRPTDTENVRELLVARYRFGIDAAVADRAVDAFLRLHPGASPVDVYHGQSRTHVATSSRTA
jgi:hypothetical protein